LSQHKDNRNIQFRRTFHQWYKGLDWALTNSNFISQQLYT
jgi:hypothetical protein